MSGILFSNEKGDNEKRPDYMGDLMVAGVRYKLTGWVKEGRKASS
jgi:hypothetical protein